jgi:hypothetical protein
VFTEYGRPEYDDEPAIGPDAERRRAKALALLLAHPQLWRVVVTEVGDPTIVGVAIRGVAYGELEIRADRYDAIALLELMNRHATETAH